nr:MAG TPA: hypothetical protein [Caudoviricetes sp.]
MAAIGPQSSLRLLPFAKMAAASVLSLLSRSQQ